MAIYKKLHLGYGSGIVSISQQADQVKDTATILIGLGGTGIDALKTLKQEIAKRLKPDDPDALVPTYDHIQFIGVDTDKTSANILPNSDYFSISQEAGGGGLLKKADTINKFIELDFLRSDRIQIPDMLDAGAGGNRQIGRLMLMRKSQRFMAFLQSKINLAKLGLLNPSVNVHIFTGLSGGTGAGCFLDICYMVKEVLREGNEQKATILGYAFLPDVNLSKNVDTQTRIYIQQNGYASMQELDYCMNLPKNGGEFKQQYYTGKMIDWADPPMDMCHLISATNNNGAVIAGAYDYAMHVVTEYLMDFLVYSEDDNFTIKSQLSNFRTRVETSNSRKISGFNPVYCALGAACATLPLTEINTYLGARVFKGFANIASGNSPSNAAVNQIAIHILAPGADAVTEIYERLLGELKKDVVDWQAFEQSYQILLPNNNAPLIQHYTNQEATRNGVLTKNTTALMDKDNAGSLIQRLHREMHRVICGEGQQVAMGPEFGYQVLWAGNEYNLFNILSQLVEENNVRLQQAEGNRALMQQAYENAERIFLLRENRGIFDIGGDGRRFADYENAVYNLENLKFDIKLYISFDGLLKTFIRQLNDAVTYFYAKLKTLMLNLVETFKENAKLLNAFDATLANQSSFFIPMMTIEDLKPMLDAEIKKVNMENLYQQFLNALFEKQGVWITEEENKIARFVTDFFVGEVFSDFTSRNITSFLQDKYRTNDPEQLIAHVSMDYIDPISMMANPLFPMDTAICPPGLSGMLSHFSVPVAAVAIEQAARNHARGADAITNPIAVNSSALTDRIYMLRKLAGFPLGSYVPAKNYGNEYFGAVEGRFGMHYYEGERVGRVSSISKMKCGDWKELAPLMPYSSIFVNETTPPTMARILKRGEELYDAGVKHGLIGKMAEMDTEESDHKIYGIDLDGLDNIKQNLQELHTFIHAPNFGMANLETAKQKVGVLEGILMPKKKEVGVELDAAGFNNSVDTERIRKDNFIASPALQYWVRKGLEDYKLLEEQTKELEKLKAILQRFEETQQSMTGFFNALFSGVITYSGLNLKYIQEEYGIKTEHELSGMDEKFPFRQIPVYQAFLSFCALSADVKKEINDKYFAKMNAVDDQIREYGKNLQERLLLQSNNWAMAAGNLAEKENILQFIRRMNQDMAVHMATIG